jgi:hypothetical protein
MPSIHSSAPLSTPPGKWEMRGVYLLVLTAIGFGLAVELRSAFMQRRMTDLGVYLRAAWAVRAGENIYDITDDNHWHYQYPPAFAILLTPLADPPAGVARAGYVPFPVSVAVWYLFSLACLVFGVHVLARAVEERETMRTGRGIVPGCRRWWSLRLIPIMACIVPIGHTLMRGQVNLLLLALLCGMAAALIRGRSYQAGAWLAAAICLKVIPAFLLIVPVWRRDARCVAACALGLVVGLVMIPAAVFGLPRTIAYYQEYDQKLLRPGLGAGTDQSRAKELIEMTANDSQSILAAMHNTLHIDRATRPAHPSAAIRWAHRIISIGLIGLLLLAAGRARPHSHCDDSPATLLLVGEAILVMLLIIPVCHLHYLCLALPVVMALVAAALERSQPPHRIGLPLTMLLSLVVVATALPHFPGLEMLRDMGLAMYAVIGLLIAGGIGLLRRRATRDEHGHLPNAQAA